VARILDLETGREVQRLQHGRRGGDYRASLHGDFLVLPTETGRIIYERR
jgi:hypothetical protein